VRGRLLVVDDDPAIRDGRPTQSRKSRVSRVVAPRTSPQPCASRTAPPVLLAILDVMLPTAAASTWQRRLREQSDIPIMLLSARDTDVDKGSASASAPTTT